MNVWATPLICMLGPPIIISFTSESGALQTLGHACWKFALVLNLLKGVDRHCSTPQRLCKNIGRRRILHRQIDSDAADGRHGMCCITDADEPWPIPSPQAVHFDGQKFHLLPAVNFMQPATKERRDVLDATTEIVEAGLLEFASGAFRNEISALLIVVPVEHDQHPSAFNVTKRFTGIAVVAPWGRRGFQH
jgi:hypothetical protein